MKENEKNLRPKDQPGGEIQIRTVGSHHCSALIRLDHYRISSASTGESRTDAGGGRHRQCFASLPPTGPEKDGLEQNRLCMLASVSHVSAKARACSLNFGDSLAISISTRARLRQSSENCMLRTLRMS